MNIKQKKKLSAIYYNPSHYGSYSTPKKLWEATNKTVSLSNIETWLKSQPAHTLHKPVRRNFPRNFYYVNNIDDQWQMDLNDMQSLQTHNDGYKYILTIIDVFSKYSWAVPLMNKTGPCVKAALLSVFKNSKRKPILLQSDKGGEFVNSTVKSFLKQQGIKYFTTKNPDVKACIVERYNKTLKERMFKYFTATGSYRYLDVLSKLVKAYNNTVHSSIKMAPADVTPDKVLQVWHTLYDKKKFVNPTFSKHVFNVGDTVRITRAKGHFAKGYEQNWTTEIFRVKRVLRRHPVVYVLEDLNGEALDGTFYNEELQRVSLPDQYDILKILDTRGKGRSKKLLVRWKGYPPSFDSWIPASQLKIKTPIHTVSNHAIQ